jgi:hypothetical protein
LPGQIQTKINTKTDTGEHRFLSMFTCENQ